MKYSLYYILVLFYFLSSCTPDIKTNLNYKKNLNSTHTFIKESTIQFPLDSLTPAESNCIQFFKKDGKSYLSFLNNQTNSILLFDYESRTPLPSIIINKEGSNGLGRVTGYNILSPDSIYIYSYAKRKLALINKSGKILDKTTILEEQEGVEYYPSPKSWTSLPMVILENKIVMGGSLAGEYTNESNKNRPIFLTINQQNEVKYQYHYPEIYQNANWGGALFRQFCYDYNPKKKQFIVSFPNEHDLLVTSDFKIDKKYYGGTQRSGDIKSLDENKLTYSKIKRREHFVTNLSYGPIVYDPYRNVYYRIAYHPVKEFINGGIGKSNVKQASIIILDNEFNWMGEYFIPLFSHSTKEFFVTEEGFYLKKYTNDENYISFSLLKLIKNE